MSDVTDMLDALAAGDMTVEELETAFRDRHWPMRTRAETDDAAGLYAADIADPGVDPPGAFADVSAAYAAGVIDATTYSVLATAAASAMRRDGPPTPGTGAATANERTR